MSNEGPADVAIVGVGSSDYRALWNEKGVERNVYTLAADAFGAALEDAGLEKDEVDGLLCSRVEYSRLADVLGMPHPLFIHDLEGSGRMSGVALQEAVALVSSGMANVVACVYGNNGRSVQQKYGGEGGGPTVAYDEMYGMTSPGAYVAMMYRRYRGMYGVPDGALAPISINQRRNASFNPAAIFQDPLDVESYMATRYITEPLRKLDYCMINDGGVAFIVTSMDRARSLRKRPVQVAASAGMADLSNLYTSEDFFFHACNDVAKRVYRQAGIAPDDVDCLQVYDNFTPTVLFTLDGFGYSARGEAWQWVQDNRTAFDGSRPVNTAGGHTSESYMQGWGHIVEAVRQLRGECGARQVPDCDVVHYMAATPITTSHVLIGR
jgi:acetyl-CoA acetyltransferase